jgi:cell division protein FtsW
VARQADRTVVFLMLPVTLLVIVGLGALLSASSVVALQDDLDSLFYFKRQLVWIALGIGTFAVAARIPYRWYAQWAVPIFLLAVAGLVATLAIGDIRGGARRWIEFGPITLQPSEFAKFATVVFLAAALSRKERWLSRFAHVFWPVVGSVGIVGLLLIAQPDLGTTILIGIASFAVLTASAAPLRHVVSLGALGTGLAGILAYAEPYRWERVVGFLNPEADPLGIGLQARQSLVALGTGGWLGVGLGASRARWSFLPNAHTDFIFSIIGEETGLAGSLIVIALFVALAVVGIVIAMRAPDRFGRLLAVGLVAWLSAQALVNIGGVAVVLPITGVPLPFVSAGGSAMIANLAVVGVLVNIAKASARQGARR